MNEVEVKHRTFRHQLQSLIDGETLRPFVCHGSPLSCRVFIVGFNPATKVKNEFWHYWSDAEGFNHHSFMEDYLATRKKGGARPRIEAISGQFPWGWSFETNICSKPTRRAKDLAKNDRRTAVFRYLLETIKPDLVFAHSNEPMAFLRDMTGVDKVGLEPVRARWGTHDFLLSGRPGPLWRMSFEDAKELGCALANHLLVDISEMRGDELELAYQNFCRRFASWNIRLPKSDLFSRRHGEIAREGWYIRYSFGADERGSYLDYTATHRMMWGEEVNRLYANGEALYSRPEFMTFA